MVVESFHKSLDNTDGKFYLVFEDSDGFEIEPLVVDFSNRDKDLSNGIISRSNTVNKQGKIVSKSFAFKKKIEVDNYKRISSVGIKWSSNLIKNLTDK